MGFLFVLIVGLVGLFMLTTTEDAEVIRVPHRSGRPSGADDPAPVVTDTTHDGFHKVSWIVGGSKLYATMVILVREMGF